MALIRPTSPRLFRHYGSPEQRAQREVRYGMGTVLWTLFKRWTFTVALGWIVTLVVALVASPFAWWSWNHGIVRAFNAPVIDWGTAYWLTLMLAMVTGMLKSSLVVNTRED